MSILSILQKIKATDSTKEKLAILEANSSNELLKTVFRLAYHPRIRFGIKKIDQPYFETDEWCSLSDALKFMENVIAARKLTGNSAINELVNILSAMSEDDRLVARLVLARDLDCGASKTLANKVWKGLISEQPQMLASSMSEKALANIEFPAYAQLKADGARCFAEISGDTIDDVKLLSRAGNEYTGLYILKTELLNRTKEYRAIHGNIMVDGELVVVSEPPTIPKANLDSFFDDSQVVEVKADQKNVLLRSESNGIVNKSLAGTIDNGEAARVSFQVWDLVPLEVIYGTEVSKPYDERFKAVSDVFLDANRVIIIENTVVNSLEEARVVYKGYIVQGLEGIILKNTFGLWEDKRSKNQVKFKEIIPIDLRVVGVTAHSKDPNKLGSVQLESDDRLIRVSCGSGFTDTTAKKIKGQWIDIPWDQLDSLNRSKLWVTQDEFIGTVVEIECNAWQLAEGRTEFVSLFLPVIKAIRYDKDTTNLLDDIFPEAVSKLS